MKFVLAPDKFKGSLTGLAFCEATEKGIRKIIPNAECIWLPLADGGDGTIEVVNFYLRAEIIKVTVSNPFFRPIEATYLYSESTKTAFIEMAEASGLKLLNPEAFDCKNATTLGTGQMIVDAINKGAKKIILGIGGSATNDCGIGMASALGYKFLDDKHQDVKPIGANLSKIATVEMSDVHGKLRDVFFEIACDVTNPLYGKNGAAYIYAKQKGASIEDIKMLDKGLEHFSKIIKSAFKVDPQSVKGAGAAGGMGIASKVFLNGSLKRGIKLIKNLANFDAKIEGANWVITGEGNLDNQTLSGKTIEGVLNSAKSKSIKTAAFCGAIDLDEKIIKSIGIQYSDAVRKHAENLEDAIKNGHKYLEKMAENFAEKLK